MTGSTAAALPVRAATTVADAFGRPLREVRISVTDRCNFRCTYCMPRDAFGPGHRFLPHAALMSASEIERLTHVLLHLGVEKVRLTGGEPLLRGDIDDIVRRVAATGIRDLAMTTNGSLLDRWAVRLRDAGLHRLTVSLDTLDPQLHTRVSDTGVPLERVLRGIEAAVAAGFHPLKLNAVIRRGVNDASIDSLVDFARTGGHLLRFIEYMDVGETHPWQESDVVPSARIVARIAQRHPLDPIDTGAPSVATWYRYRDGAGDVGVIASVTAPFCRDCTRLRVSADGRLHGCLFTSDGVDVLRALRGGDDEDVARIVRALWQPRTDRYSEQRAALGRTQRRLEMSYLGG